MVYSLETSSASRSRGWSRYFPSFTFGQNMSWLLRQSYEWNSFSVNRSVYVRRLSQNSILARKFWIMLHVWRFVRCLVAFCCKVWTYSYTSLRFLQSHFTVPRSVVLIIVGLRQQVVQNMWVYSLTEVISRWNEHSVAKQQSLILFFVEALLI